jgi:peptidoglycan/xylan/chitin deacetylase (PgdA/CDA1 family)
VKAAAASVAWGCGLWEAARLLRVRVLRAPVLLILCYHRITDVPFTVSARCVGPARFAEQLAFFRTHYDVAALADVPALLRDQLRLRRDTVIFTFDDGYVDGYTCAAPLLEAFGIRGTFFVSTGPSLDREPYWMDRVGAALGRGTGADHGPAGMARLADGYRAAGADDRPAAARAIIDALKRMEAVERSRAVSALAPSPGAPGAPRVMSAVELAELAARGHEIAAHGATHVVLSRVDGSTCREEIVGAVRRLREAGFRIESLAYPFGGADEVGEVAPRLATECGIRVGVTTEERVVAPDDDPLRLPRKVVSSQPIPLFAAHLERLAWRALRGGRRARQDGAGALPDGAAR